MDRNSRASGDALQVLLDKVKKQGVVLGSICDVNQGIVTGADRVSKRHIDKYAIKANVGDGIFVLSDEEAKRLHLTGKEKEILKPWFKNSDIHGEGTITITNEHLLYIDREVKTLGDSIKEHLKKYRGILDERREVKNGVINWWQLQWPREQSIFESPKIVAPQRSPRNTFGYNEIPWYASADVYFITERDKSVSLKYVLALLNSKLYYLWLYHRGKRKGEMLELYQQPLSEIPIRRIPLSGQQPFVDLVDKILLNKQSTDDSDTSGLELEIDKLVYQLYGLSPDEIALIESTVIPPRGGNSSLKEIRMNNEQLL
jgi:adenine-specific DNA-methyltransferase